MDQHESIFKVQRKLTIRTLGIPLLSRWWNEGKFSRRDRHRQNEFTKHVLILAKKGEQLLLCVLIYSKRRALDWPRPSACSNALGKSDRATGGDTMAGRMHVIIYPCRSEGRSEKINKSKLPICVGKQFFLPDSTCNARANKTERIPSPERKFPTNNYFHPPKRVLIKARYTRFGLGNN